MAGSGDGKWRISMTLRKSIYPAAIHYAEPNAYQIADMESGKFL